MGKQHIDLNNQTILVTGSPGFIGANLVLRLLKEMAGGTVISLDNMNDYYDPALKEYRLSLIEKAAKSSPVRHVFVRGSIADKALVDDVFAKYKPAVVVNLAAQAGVRYSIDHPDVYIESTQDGVTENAEVDGGAEQDNSEEEQSGEEEPADSKAVPITSMDISIPAYAVSPVQLKNLVYMLYSRQPLINRMTDSDCLNIPDSLIDRLRENTLETAKAFTSWLDDAKADGLTGFDFRDSKVSMTFPFDETQPTKWTAYANLLNRIFDAAMKATRVFPDRVEPNDQNEKYLAHVWLQRLGYAGPDYKAERKILLGHLKGYCAFANADKQQAHKEKYTTIRRERRLADQEAAVLEVMVEEGTGNE